MTSRTKRIIAPLLLLICSGILLVSFIKPHKTLLPDYPGILLLQAGAPFAFAADSVPPEKKDINERIDDQIRMMEKSLEKMQLEMKKMDFSKMQQELESAMKNIDMDKIKLQVQDALAKIDYKKMQDELERSLKDINAEKIKASVDDAIAKIDMKKIQEEMEKVKTELKENLDPEKLKKEIEEAQKINFEQLEQEMKEMQKNLDLEKLNLKKMKLDFDKELNNAKDEMAKAKEELKGYKEMIELMKKDGLLKEGEDFEIELKNGELFINGQKQSKETSARFRKYFKKENVLITDKAGDFNIKNNH